MTPSEQPLPPPGGTSEWRSRSSTISEGERMGVLRLLMEPQSSTRRAVTRGGWIAAG